MMTAPFRRKLVSATFSLINKMQTILSPRRAPSVEEFETNFSRNIKKYETF